MACLGTWSAIIVKRAHLDLAKALGVKCASRAALCAVLRAVLAQVPYEEQALKDKERYAKAMAAYKAAGGAGVGDDDEDDGL